MGSLKIGVALWSLGSAPTFEDFEKLLDKAADANLKAVQPWCVDVKKWNIVCALDPDRCATPPQRLKIRRACEKRGLELSGFCAQLAGPATIGGFSENDPEHDARLEKTRKALRMAADLNAPIVTAHIGAIPHDKDCAEYARALKSVVSVMKDAERCGGILALETGQEPAQQLREFIEDVGSPNLKVNYDPANMLEHGAVAGVEILAPYIVHTHAKDKHPKTGRPTVGQGAVPWKDYLNALKQIGYNGWYMLEDESNESNVMSSITIGRKFLEQF
ncbi:MAG TPA: sugar phosphate isomerase/epimerase family protein [Planctomycetota bacterium]|nr:sugar phosphate isomerase/epimerase family protein [Planctomycetota bacterium]